MKKKRGILKFVFTAVFLLSTLWGQAQSDSCSTTIKSYLAPTMGPMPNYIYSFRLEGISADEIQEIWWDFGDGTTSSDIYPTHKFSYSGKYNICAKYISKNGVCHDCFTDYFEGIPQISDSCYFDISYYPAPYISSVQYAWVFEIINILGLNKGDQSLTFPIRLPEVQWIFSDGTTATGYSVVHGFKASGEYTITAIVSDYGDTCVLNVTDYFNINDGQNCNHWIETGVAETFAPTPAPLYTFGLNESADDSIEYIHWDFGDGTTSEDFAPVHMFNYSGNFDVCATYIVDKAKCKTFINKYFEGKPDASRCKFKGIVKSYMGLDGCDWMIQMEDGTALHPIFDEMDVKLYDGQRIRFSYDSVDVYNTCMAGQTVRITCFTALDTLDISCKNLGLQLNTGFILGQRACNGTAMVNVIDLKTLTQATGFNYLWSNGISSNNLSNLCPNQLYSVKAFNGSCTLEAAFSVFSIPGVNSTWSYVKDGDQYHFSFPVPEDNYDVSWYFDNGEIITGASVSHKFEEGNEGNVKVVLTDDSGTVLYSESFNLNKGTTAIINHKATNQLLVFPNPVSTYLDLKYTNMNSEASKYEVWNVLGSKVLTGDISNTDILTQTQIDVSELEPGIYFISVPINGEVISSRFIKR